jgi:hypothetical protein
MPGRYDILIGNNILFGYHIRAADLHEGEQSLQPFRMPLTFTSQEEEYVTVGEIVTSDRYPISSLLRHPLRYLKHLLRNS